MVDSVLIPFTHRQAAHCESGVVSNLLGHQGLEFSEAMVFGLGRGLFFGYFPFIRINGLPLITYRAAAGRIIQQFSRMPGFSLVRKTYRDRSRAMADLDAVLERGVPVGLQTGVFWLPYFPRALRFHFNAHNLVVYGKEGDEYLISDPVFPDVVRCRVADLMRARFASGALAPRGKMYYFNATPGAIDIMAQTPAAIGDVCRAMVGGPLPLIGVKGIRFLAGRLERWPSRLGTEKATLHLGHVVRMQEEIGTGGGGFRFMFAVFLKEVGALLADATLRDSASQMTVAGDAWRQFAAMAARLCKGRGQSTDSYPALAELLRRCAARENGVFQTLRSWSR